MVATDAPLEAQLSAFIALVPLLIAAGIFTEEDTVANALRFAKSRDGFMRGVMALAAEGERKEANNGFLMAQEVEDLR